MPETHNGVDAFTFRLHFSEDIATNPETLRDHSLHVTGGTVSSAGKVGDSGRIWEITVAPASTGDVTIALPAGVACEVPGAICTAAGRQLHNRPAFIVPCPECAVPCEDNRLATGAPTITGTVRVGETLRAETSVIADADGLQNATFNYQWLADDADISGATESTYTLSEAVEGKAIRVRVSFTDDADNQESLTSEDGLVWSATMTAGRVYRGYGYYWTDAKKAGALSPASFKVDGTTYTVNMIEAWGWMYIGTDRELPFDFVLELDGARFASDDASFGSYTYGNIYEWRGTDLSWNDGDTVEIRLLRTVEDETATNSPATGAPTVSGTVQVGETLAANMSGVADNDGLANACFAYQWMARGTDIHGANGSSLALTTSEYAQAIQVRVSFADDSGNRESLTSAATDAVAAPEIPARPTGLSANVSNYAVTLTWDNPRDDTITGYVILRRNREATAEGQFTPLAVDTGTAATTYTDDSVKTNTHYTYRIKAINVGGTSERSRWAHVDTPEWPALTVPPEALHVATGASQELLVSWEAPLGGPLAAGYKVQWKSGTKDFDGSATSTRQAVLTDLSTLTYTIDGLTNGTDYTVRVIGYSPTGDGPPSAEETAAPEAPNVIVIFVDDLGYNDVSFNGAEQIDTPNLDRLAAEGVTFTNGYVTASVCSPSRSGLLTGRYPARFGLEDNLAYNPFDKSLGLPTREKLLPFYLDHAGYYTGVVGKWHLGAARKFTPLQRGFDYFYGFLGGGHDYWKIDASDAGNKLLLSLVENQSPASFTGYLTDALTDKALEFVNEDREQPFFLYLPYNAPHSPFQAPAELIEKYAHVSGDDRRIYLAMVDSLDQNVGRLLEALEQSGKRDNTIIFFLSDNGGDVSRGAMDNGELRDGKGSLYEGGIRVPFVASWPARWPQGETYDPVVISLDIFATALGVAKATVTDQSRPIDGVNLDPYLRAEQEGRPHEAVFWRETRSDKVSVVRSGDMKLIQVDGGTAMLFNLANDIGEEHDLFETETETAVKLADLWNQWNMHNVKATRVWGRGDYVERFNAWLNGHAAERRSWMQEQPVQQIVIE